ncbi:MAG: D-alanine--D-alanine ligase family protein [Candidatus Dependentiae bacterium]
MAKLRVGVLMGGKSLEREVSFNSGRTVCDHLDPHRYAIVPIFQTEQGKLYILPQHFLHRGKISDFAHRLKNEAQCIAWDELNTHIDFAYIAMHGSYAEDGTLQGMLELFNIPYLGSKLLGSALSMDKTMQKKLLNAKQITTPKGLVLNVEEITQLDISTIDHKLQALNLTFPLVVKPYHEGSSYGVSIVKNNNDLLEAIQKACAINPTYDQAVLIEEKIEGMEFSCIILTDYKTNTVFALEPTEIVADKNLEYFDYAQKYMPGKATEYTPARCSEQVREKIKQTCIKVMQELNFQTMARIDGFVTEDGTVVIIDPNSLSGMAPSSFLFVQAAHHNMSHSQLINYLIESELHAYGMLEKVLRFEQQEMERMHVTKKRVAVLMGGQSNEKEISLESGRNITYKLAPHKYETIPLFVNKDMKLYHLPQQLLVKTSTHEIETFLDETMHVPWSCLPTIADFVFIGLHGGQGENGVIQGALEMLGLPYNGSGVVASSLCMDKYKTNRFLQSQGFDIPQGMLLPKNEWEANQASALVKIQQLPLPLIVKPHDDGCSVLVQKITKLEQLEQALNILFAQKDYALIEECINGMELTVGVIGNDNPFALPPSQAVTTGDILSIEEKFLPGAGENQTPAPLPESALNLVKQTMEAAYKAVGCKGYARIDCFYQSAQQSPTGNERVIFIEFNTLPAMTPATCLFHQAAELGMKPMEFIDKIITLGFQEHTKQLHKQSKPTMEQIL